MRAILYPMPEMYTDTFVQGSRLGQYSASLYKQRF